MKTKITGRKALTKAQRHEEVKREINHGVSRSTTEWKSTLPLCNSVFSVVNRFYILGNSSKQEKHIIFRQLPNLLALFLTLFFLFGCPPAKPSGAGAEGAREAEKTESLSTPEEELPAPDAVVFREPRFVLIPPSARPGEAVTVGYGDNFDGPGRAAKGLQAVLLNAEGKRLTKAAFFSLASEETEPTIMAAILAVPSTAAFGEVSILIESSGGIINILPFAIEPRDFPSETIALNQENTDLRTAPDPKKTSESEMLWAIITRTGNEIYSGDQFVSPVSSTRRTSAYGDRRVYKYTGGGSDTTIHAGIDIGVPTGTEVRACARGKVVLARPRIVTGNTVILEHLPGLYSLYYHMDKISVQEGIIVEAGFPLGESGSTGLATGPHLHWEIRVSSENADPDVFLSRPILDKKDILDKLMSSE